MLLLMFTALSAITILAVWSAMRAPQISMTFRPMPLRRRRAQGLLRSPLARAGNTVRIRAARLTRSYLDRNPRGVR